MPLERRHFIWTVEKFTIFCQHPFCRAYFDCIACASINSIDSDPTVISECIAKSKDIISFSWSRVYKICIFTQSAQMVRVSSRLQLNKLCRICSTFAWYQRTKNPGAGRQNYFMFFEASFSQVITYISWYSSYKNEYQKRSVQH